jgi:hypothetical protein
MQSMMRKVLTLGELVTICDEFGTRVVFYEWNRIASKPPVGAESELSSWRLTGRKEKGMSIPDDFQQLLQQERIANEQFLAGDAGPAKLHGRMPMMSPFAVALVPMRKAGNKSVLAWTAAQKARGWTDPGT